MSTVQLFGVPIIGTIYFFVMTFWLVHALRNNDQLRKELKQLRNEIRTEKKRHLSETIDLCRASYKFKADTLKKYGVENKGDPNRESRVH